MPRGRGMRSETCTMRPQQSHCHVTWEVCTASHGPCAGYTAKAYLHAVQLLRLCFDALNGTPNGAPATTPREDSRT